MQKTIRLYGKEVPISGVEVKRNPATGEFEKWTFYLIDDKRGEVLDIRPLPDQNFTRDPDETPIGMESVEPRRTLLLRDLAVTGASQRIIFSKSWYNCYGETVFRHRTPKEERLYVEKKPDMLTIAEAAAYNNVTERTICTWRKSKDDHGNPMLPGAVKVGRKICIPRADLDKWRKPHKTTHKPQVTPRERPKGNRVKHRR